MRDLVHRGIQRMAKYPMPTMSTGDTISGSKMAIGVGLARAWISVKMMSAITSSKMAAAMISCPVGVLRILAFLRTFRAMPIEVGAKQAAMAMDDIRSVPMNRYGMTNPIDIGKKEPSNAMANPRGPMSLSI